MSREQYYSVSRIEGDTAILECPDGAYVELSTELLPSGVKEGSILIRNGSGKLSFDFDEENRRKKKFFDLQNKIFDK